MHFLFEEESVIRNFVAQYVVDPEGSLRYGNSIRQYLLQEFGITNTTFATNEEEEQFMAMLRSRRYNADVLY